MICPRCHAKHTVVLRLENATLQYHVDEIDDYGVITGSVPELLNSADAVCKFVCTRCSSEFQLDELRCAGSGE